MTYRVSLHPLVRDDLDKIGSWLLEFAGMDVADRRVLEIYKAVYALEMFPHLGTIRNEILPGLRAIPAADQEAVIAFIVNDDDRTVLVLTIGYGGSDWISRSLSRF